MIPAELSQVLLYLAAELIRARRIPFPPRVAAWPYLRDDHEVVGIRRERRVDEFVGRAQRRKVERRRVDMVHAKLDRPPQHRDRPGPVARSAILEREAAGQAHRAEAHPVDRQVAKLPCARRRRGQVR